MAEEESSPISRESLLASMTADEMEKMLQLLRRPVTSPASSNASPNGNNNATEVNATSSSVHTSPYRSCNIESNPLVLEREDHLLGPMADGCIRICEGCPPQPSGLRTDHVVRGRQFNPQTWRRLFCWHPTSPSPFPTRS